MQRATVEEIRADIPALEQYVWFQNGGVSVTPRAIAAEHARPMEELVVRGPMHIVYPDEEYPRRARSKAALARLFGVAPETLALMRGVSEAYQTVLRGLDWRRGDQLLITDEEEAALYLPSLHLRDRHGVEVVKVPLLADPEEQLEAFAACISDRTRLLAVSHVTTETGFRLPVEQLCGLARERGVLTFVDAAHSAGLFPIDLAALGCDFAGILSYKWMYAPYAAGALYVRPDRLEAIQVTYAGGRAEAWLRYDTDDYALKDGAEQFEYGPWSWPLVHTWAFAAGYLTEIGLESIWTRTAQLTHRLKLALAKPFLGEDRPQHLGQSPIDVWLLARQLRPGDLRFPSSLSHFDRDSGAADDDVRYVGNVRKRFNRASPVIQHELERVLLHRVRSRGDVPAVGAAQFDAPLCSPQADGVGCGAQAPDPVEPKHEVEIRD